MAMMGYYGPGNVYYPPFMMNPNAYPNSYTYAWGSQPPPMPSFPTMFIYHSLSNEEKLGRVQQTSQPPPMPRPPSSTKEELRSFEKTASNAETTPFISESETNVGGTSLLNEENEETDEVNEENSDND
ncbi:uncharacterized protein LOC122282234 [Carya illinoinensis]|uniref:uncharacterized protein LOC122282234 n=1 Tax=Carya illinoinensis TaxID=32201 RepID=UPI001C71F7AD|nr:uncharacterized protein LOC122282234 [Carya illinoinensis]